MLNELIKKLYSAWQTFDLGKGDYDSELFKSYKNKFLTEALDSVSKATVLMEMAGKKLPPDAAMLAELIQHLATDAKKTNDIAIYIHIEQIYDLFCLLFVPNDELHKVTYTALKEGKRNKGIAQVRTLKNYSQEMNSFFETEKIRIDKSRIQAKKTEATSRAESSNKKPKEKGITTTAKPQHKECSNPKLQAIINLFPSPLFNKKIYSTLGDCETIHANEFMNLRLADMKAKYYNFLLLPRALDYPEAHAQVLVNLLDEQDRDLDWKLILAIYNNACTNLTSSSKDLLFRIFKRLCGVGKHDVALEVFKTHQAAINIDIYFRMLDSMEPNKDHITAMLELGLKLGMYLPNITLMEYYLQKYGINSKISQHTKDFVYSEHVKFLKTTIDLHGAPKKAVKGIIRDFVENWKDEKTGIVVSHGGGTHVAFSQFTSKDMNDVQFFSPAKQAVYEAVRELRYKWRGKYAITVSPYQTPKGHLDYSNSVISKKSLNNELKQIAILESTRQNKPKDGDIEKIIAPVEAVTVTHASLPSSDDSIIFTTTTAVTQEDLTPKTSQPKATSQMNPAAFEYKPKQKSDLFNPPPVEANSNHFRAKEEKSPPQPTMSPPYVLPPVISYWYPGQTFFAYAPTYQPACYYMEHVEDEIQPDTEHEEPDTPSLQKTMK